MPLYDLRVGSGVKLLEIAGAFIGPYSAKGGTNEVLELLARQCEFILLHICLILQTMNIVSDQLGRETGTQQRDAI